QGQARRHQGPAQARADPAQDPRPQPVVGGAADGVTLCSPLPRFGGEGRKSHFFAGTISKRSTTQPAVPARNEFPFGANASERAKSLPLLRSITSSSLPLPTSHIRTDRSSLAERSVLPSGERARAVTQFLCPSKACTALPVSTLQTLMSLSWLP